MYVGFESHSQWFSLRLWCLHGFDYGSSLVQQNVYAIKTGLYYTVSYHLFKVIILWVMNTMEQL